MSPADQPNWVEYELCPVCFRSGDCRSVLRPRSKILVRYGGIAYMSGWRVAPVGTWGDKSLKRPHKGRKRRVG